MPKIVLDGTGIKQGRSSQYRVVILKRQIAGGGTYRFISNYDITHKLFSYLYKLAMTSINYDKGWGPDDWVHQDRLEAQNVAKHIYWLRKELGIPGLIENKKPGFYRINPEYDIKITKKAHKLMRGEEEG